MAEDQAPKVVEPKAKKLMEVKATAGRGDMAVVANKGQKYDRKAHLSKEQQEK